MSWMPKMIDLEYNVQTDCGNISTYPEKGILLRYLKNGSIDIELQAVPEMLLPGKK